MKICNSSRSTLGLLTLFAISLLIGNLSLTNRKFATLISMEILSDQISVLFKACCYRELPSVHPLL